MNSVPLARKTNLPRAHDLFLQQQLSIHKQADALFLYLMPLQWLAGIVTAYFMSPLPENGIEPHLQSHVWSAVFLGGVITAFPLTLILTRPGTMLTRYSVAACQLMMSSLLIQLTNGHLETHFHEIGSLAILAYYQDWRVLIPATIVTTLDHLLRGWFYPMSIYGSLTGSEWRWLEHLIWIVFIDVFLLFACRRNTREMWENALHTAEALHHRERHAALRADIGEILATPNDSLREILQHSTEAIVRHLDAAFARIWTLNANEQILELQASAGLYTHLDGAHQFVPVGAYKIGGIAATRLPHLTNDVQNDERVSNREWAQREGMVSFAGYPLLVGDSVVGVLAMFAREPLADQTLEALAIVANSIAQRIRRQAAEDDLLAARRELENRVRARTVELVRANELLKIEVNERKRAERELNQAQNFLHNVINNLPNPIFVKDETGKFSLVNTAFAQMYGQSATALIGKTDADVYPPEEAQKFAGDDQQVLESLEEKFILEEKRTDYTGQVRFMQTIKRPLILGENSSRLLLGISTDLTERKALESQLRQAHKLESIGQLAAGIAHEINTPTQFVGDNTRFVKDSFSELSTVLEKFQELLDSIHEGNPSASLIEQVEQQYKLTDVKYLLEEIPTALQQSLEGVNRIARIVQSMKDFAHPGSNEKKPSDINKAIESTITVARNEWKYVAEVETHFDDRLPTVPCVLDEFNQVILNIIVNAAHAIADVTGKDGISQGKITITTQNIANQWAEIRISDTGAGIPPEVRNRIFDPFFTTKEVGKGTGQGLAISHNVIVEKHQGQLSFETEMGCGTTFIIRLPLNKSES